MPTLQAVMKKSRLNVTETQLILAHLLDCSRTQLYVRDHEILNDEIYAQWLILEQKRVDGYPMAYLRGEKECYSLNFQVTPDVLIPRPETEILIEYGLNYLKNNPQARVLDLGTGSGVIACVLAHFYPNARIMAADISEKALTVAKNNAQRLNILNITWVHSDGLQNIESIFDLILSNPPYLAENDHHLATDIRFEPLGALVSGKTGLECLTRFAREAVAYLATNGVLAMEHGWDQAQAVAEILNQAGYVDVETLQDLAGMDRVTLGRC